MMFPLHIAYNNNNNLFHLLSFRLPLATIWGRSTPQQVPLLHTIGPLTVLLLVCYNNLFN